MEPLLFNLNAADDLFDGVSDCLGGEPGRMTLRDFPDGESYLRFETDCAHRHVALLCSLDRPNARTIPLLLASGILRDLGAESVGLIAPYLPYMRQDKVFHDGEGITARHYANLISTHFDWLVTVDPHLHRIAALDEIVAIPNRVVQSAPLLADWVVRNVNKAILIGPDSESRQWVSAVAGAAQAPFLILEKERLGDRQVRLSEHDAEIAADQVPVLIDDIVSTGRTLLATVEHLVGIGAAAPICIAVHGVFADSVTRELGDAGAARLVTCNTIAHPTNRIDVSALIGAAAGELMRSVASTSQNA